MLPNAATMPASVLVVEADPLTRQTIAYMLEVMGYIVVAFETVEAAYQVLDGVVMNVVIISLGVDDEDGVNLAMDAKAYQPGIKVIVVSGRGVPASLNSLVDAYVQKPFSMAQINAAISGLVPSRQNANTAL